MSNRFHDRQPSAQDEQAYAGASQHFAEHLKQFPASREAVGRIERNIARIALAANMAVSKPTANGNVIHADDGTQWHKCVDLMDNICLCHRSIAGGAEYAVLEHFPAHHTNEIWNRGWNVVEVLKMFAQEQRQALQVWTKDLTAQVKEFLTEQYPDQNMSRVADRFMHRFERAPSQQHPQSHEQNHNRSIQI